MAELLEIYVDADACPVKLEVCKVAKRHQVNVTFVSNSRMRVPEQQGVKLVVVPGNFDAADDWIVEHVARDDIVVTSDIPLASRCIKVGSRVLEPNGRIFTDANIGQALSTRDLLSELREAGAVMGGPRPFQPRNRSDFLQALDRIFQDIKRSAPHSS